MNYLCYLVSRPLDNNKPPPPHTTKWETIGNGNEVPRLLDRRPFLEHWAFCMVPDERVDGERLRPAEPPARDAFLHGLYFDLGIQDDQQGFLKRLWHPKTLRDIDSQTWPEGSVKMITSIEELGSTTNTESMVFDCKRVLLEMWDQYLPILWNCQHLALMLAQIAVSSQRCTAIICALLSMRSEWVSQVRVGRHCGFIFGSGAMTLIPVVGPAASFGVWLVAGAYMVTDGMKDEKIRERWRKLARRYPQLQEVSPLIMFG
ncbi:hypothetical protein S40288_10609 [Stachybotrys chartarum IBT 40288]|nr:hypothetical protein S40288_10609 [Stachybotrys chartarum IBT 40288]